MTVNVLADATCDIPYYDIPYYCTYTNMVISLAITASPSCGHANK
jgi:hypothetical protein